MENTCLNIYFQLCELDSNDLETFQAWKYGISKEPFILKSSTPIVGISYGTAPN